MRQEEIVEVGKIEGEVNGVDDGNDLISILGSKNRDFLLNPNGTQVKISDLEGKIVGIYFSANWCQPCHKFNPALTNAYEQLKNYDPGFEVVFVSSDEDQNAFDAYRALMPWLAIPFSDLESKRALNQRFDIEGIPCLIIYQPNNYNKDSTIIDGVDHIYRYGVQAYPFTKERVEELAQQEKDKHENQNLRDLLTCHDRDFLLSRSSILKQVPVTSLIGKTIGLYFSAQWCSPGLKFTPKLDSIYGKINQETTPNINHGFEIVFVSSDHNQSSFDTYFQTMSWLALPYDDPNIKKLARHFDVRGIPSLVIVGPDGKTVTKLGRNLVNLYGENAFPFTEARIELLTRQADQEAKNLPEFEYHSGHCHELTLVSEGNGGGPYICCDCDEQGSGWAYQCMGCGYEVHPKCVRAVCRG